MGSVSTQIEAMDVCCGCVWRRGAASCCCLFLLLVPRSLACTRSDRVEWIVFFLLAFQWMCRLAYVLQPDDPQRIQNRMSV